MVHKTEDGEKQTGFATIGVTHQAWDFIFVPFLVVIKQPDKIFTEAGNHLWLEAVFKDLAKVLRSGGLDTS